VVARVLELAVSRLSKDQPALHSLKQTAYLVKLHRFDDAATTITTTTITTTTTTAAATPAICHCRAYIGKQLF
jgi:hypothetical protein